MTFSNRLKNYYVRKRLESYSNRSDSLFRNSLYDLRIYKKFLSKLKENKSFTIINFDEKIDQKKSNIIFRHDLDTLNCLKKSDLLIELHLINSVPLSIFVRMDDMDYSASDSYPYVSKYLGQIPVGLHSSCYIHDDPWDALHLEIKKFQDAFGFTPKFLTLHGLGQYKYDARVRLMNEISQSYREYGFEFADFIPKLRHYDYVIQDCHLNDGKRYIKKDMQIIPPSITRTCYLFLAHPCYWN